MTTYSLVEYLRFHLVVSRKFGIPCTGVTPSYFTYTTSTNCTIVMSILLTHHDLGHCYFLHPEPSLLPTYTGCCESGCMISGSGALSNITNELQFFLEEDDHSRLMASSLWLSPEHQPRRMNEMGM